jgi:UDP-glucuronate 4-epimerase
MKKILVTGAAGFIGFHLSKKLLSLGYEVTGIDNINDYYDVNLKLARLKILEKLENFYFHKIDISDHNLVNAFGASHRFPIIINLAAQAGVQYSIENPHVYIDSNIKGFLNILELSKTQDVEHLIYASSSSVYGLNPSIPFSELDAVDHPISLYAATKKSNELMAHTYSYLHDINTTGLRFFTVYGPWGRPDMALFKFTKAIIENSIVKINNHGDHSRDFTYIDDIIDGIVSVIDHSPDSFKRENVLSPAESSAPWRVLNIGRGEQVHLMDFIKNIEIYFDKELKKDFQPLQPGDVPNTFCDTTRLRSDYAYQPSVSIEAGVKNFLDWYVDFYNINLGK